MDKRDNKKLEAGFTITFLLVFALVFTLHNYQEHPEVTSLLGGLIFIPIALAYGLYGKGRLSPMRWWQIILALFGIFLGPALITYLVVWLMGRI